MLEDGEFPQQCLVPQLFANNDVRYRRQRIVPRRSVVDRDCEIRGRRQGGHCRVAR